MLSHSSAAPAQAHPYSLLTPDLVLDALASVGALGDGRLQALSSYENRVYLIHLEQPCAGLDALVAKFYRPGRWSEAQILEEHAFALELMEAEIPVVGPIRLQGRSLHHHGGFAFSLSPRRGGRAPELDDPEVLEWIGRFLARIHNVGASAPLCQPGHAGPGKPGQRAARLAAGPRGLAPGHALAMVRCLQSGFAACRKSLCPGRLKRTPDAPDPAAWRLPSRQYSVDAGRHAQRAASRRAALC